MRRHSPPYYSPPRRGYTSRGRSPPRRVYDSPPRRVYDSPPRRGYDSPPRRGYGSPQRRGYGSPPRRGYGGFGRNKEQNNGSLLVRNIPLDCRPEELRVPFERFGLVRDVYLPKDYYTGEPRGFAFVQFVDPYDAAEAQYHMNGQIFAGREISVVVAAETRKRPEDMRKRTRISSSYRGPSGYGGRRSSYYGRSRPRSLSRSRSPPRYPAGSRSRHRSRSYSPGPRGREGDSISPDRRQEDLPRSPRDLRRRRETNGQRNSYSPGYDDGDDAVQNRIGNGLDSRSPSGSRSRSAD